MSPEEFKVRMDTTALLEDADREKCRCRAGELVCELLESLGYGDGADVYKGIIGII